MLVENATSPWGQSWERIFHKHLCIQFIALVLSALVVWTVCTCACGKPFPKIVPMAKLDSSKQLEQMDLSMCKVAFVFLTTTHIRGHSMTIWHNYALPTSTLLLVTLNMDKKNRYFWILSSCPRSHWTTLNTYSEGWC